MADQKDDSGEEENEDKNCENIAKSVKILNSQISLSKHALALGISHIDFRFSTEYEKLKCVKLISALLKEIQQQDQLKDEYVGELNALEKENKRMLNSLKDQNNQIIATQKNKDMIETRSKLNSKKFANIKTQLKSKIDCFERENMALNGMHRALKHKIRKIEQETRELQQQLSAKIQRNSPRKFNFCLNSEKMINDFRKENDILKKEAGNNVTEKRLETQLTLREKENKCMRSCLFEFKSILYEILLRFRDELETFDSNSTSVIFDFGSEYQNLPFSAVGDLLIAGIRSSLIFINKKLEQPGKNPPPKNTKAVQTNPPEKEQSLARRINELERNIERQKTILRKQQILLEGDKENSSKLLGAKSEADELKKEHANFSVEKSRLEALSVQLEKEQLKTKREREELEAEKQFWLDKFGKRPKESK